MAGEKIIEKISLEKPVAIQAQPEKAPSPENKAETIQLVSGQTVETPKPLEKSGEGNIIVSGQAKSLQDQRSQEIDTILAEGLNEVFLKLNREQQQEFKVKGEETVVKINALLSKTKVKVNEIISLIKKWLKLIPGVNKFFLEQEAKIKADKIMRLHDK